MLKSLNLYIDITFGCILLLLMVMIFVCAYTAGINDATAGVFRRGASLHSEPTPEAEV